MVDLLAQTVDQAAAGAVEPGQQAAPKVPAAPKSLASRCVVHREVRIRGPIAEMEGQIRSKPPVLEWTPNTVGFNFGGKHKDQLCLLAALNHLISSPLLNFTDRVAAYGRKAGLIFEID